MTMLLIEKTKQEKIINEAQKKRNLFGLGLTSLIAACGATENAAENGAVEVGIGTIPTEGLMAADADQANAATFVSLIIDTQEGSNYPVDRVGLNDLRVRFGNGSEIITHATNTFSATFNNGRHTSTPLAKVSGYKDLAVAGENSLVVSSSEFGDPAGAANMITGGIYIFWNINNGALIDNVDPDNNTKRLKVVGVAESDVIASDTPEFHQIGGAKAGEADQYDMVFRSGSVDINILWDVTQHATTTDAGATTVTLGAADNGILQVQGSELTGSNFFVKVNSNEDYDMVAKGPTFTYILWDVAKYHDPVKNVVVDLADTNATGFLKITGTGTEDPDFIKVNNNDGYDMIVRDAANTYILWDVANYHNAADPKAVNVNLAGTDENAAATHGLLTIKGAILGGINIMTATMGNDEIGLTDIDGNGINDLAFVFSDTFILFGEKVANRDGNGKAISHTVDMNAIEGYFDVARASSGFFSADEFLGTATATGQPADAIGYRFATNIAQTDLDDLTKIKAVYETANPSPTDGTPALSEEVYWDIA